MPAYKDDKSNTWYVSFYYETYQGIRKKKLKRGFQTKRDAQQWERSFLLKQSANLDMTFEDFVEIYKLEIHNRIRENTVRTKNTIIENKILPYFKNKKMNDILPKDVISWQNEMIKYKNKQGKPYSPVYLKTIYNQLSAIFNYAVRFYDLKSNSAAKAGNMGKEKNKEMLFWTKD